MDIVRAYAILGLSSSASPGEVRSSYLDLVQVWHPDRFVNNPALQRKAEEKLKEINEAFTRLTSGGRVVDPITTFRSETASAEPPSNRASRSTQTAENVPKDEARSRFAGGLFWVVVVIVVFMAMLSLGVLRQTVSTTAVSPRISYDQSVRDSREKADSPADTSLLNENLLNWRKTSKRKLASKIEPDPEQRQSIESACAGAKYVDGPTAYQRCVSQQLASLTTSPARPDLSTVDGEQRQSIESACAKAKYLDGPAAYQRCVSQQLASLAKSPPRPDLSTLDVDERQSIESVCASAKYLEGPAGYYRCLSKQVRLLEAR